MKTKEIDISKILEYTKHEKNNFKNGKVIIAENNKDIENFIKFAKNNNSNKKLYFGKIGPELANKIKKELNINLENFNLSLQANAIRHIIKNHGNEKEENARGQAAISNKDFILIPQIISNYDKINFSGTTENNNITILFQKAQKEKLFLIIYISYKNHNLEIKTFWKSKKNSATLSNALP